MRICKSKISKLYTESTSGSRLGFPFRDKTSIFYSFFLFAFINTHHKTVCIAVCKFPVSSKIGSGSREIKFLVPYRDPGKL